MEFGAFNDFKSIHGRENVIHFVLQRVVVDMFEFDEIFAVIQVVIFDDSDNRVMWRLKRSIYCDIRKRCYSNWKNRVSLL
ncbi:hypothetical protein BDD12DRAFT_870325, partial [Trichophaea hybrida]